MNPPTHTRKIFVKVPFGLVTGGAELLHQLVSEINNNNGNAFVVYTNNANQSFDIRDIPDDYKKYNIMVASAIEDESENIIVLPEILAEETMSYKNASIVIWWLSVDNFFIAHQRRINPFDIIWFDKELSMKMILWHLRVSLKKHPVTFSVRSLRKAKNLICNAYQSAYAREYLAKKKFKNIVSLSDYINPSFLNVKKPEKIDAIAYNPSKGITFTKKLIAAAPELHFIPIKGLTRQGVVDLLSQCKIYVDFGTFPGKDRIPREAALCDCLIITNRKGAAKFQEDFPIPTEYKLNESIGTKEIVKFIKRKLELYNSEIEKFANYKKNIMSEMTRFKNEVKELFGN